MNVKLLSLPLALASCSDAPLWVFEAEVRAQDTAIEHQSNHLVAAEQGPYKNAEFGISSIPILPLDF